MTLHHEHGEIIKAYGMDFVVVPLMKWADTPMFLEAYANGLRIMRKRFKGLERFDPTEILVQEYHKAGRLLFIFHKRTPGSGKDYYAPVPVMLSPDLMNEMIMCGRWPRSARVNLLGA